MLRNVKKIIVIGCPGSGKSTFSRALREKTGLPLCYLDMLFWNADKTTVERSVFLERLSFVMEGDAWIIDGNYAATLEDRLKACDTAFFLDYPTEVCLSGVEARRGKRRDDMPWIEVEEDENFTEFVKAFEKDTRPQILTLLDKYSERNIIIFKSREESDAYLNGDNL